MPSTGRVLDSGRAEENRLEHVILLYKLAYPYMHRHNDNDSDNNDNKCLFQTISSKFIDNKYINKKQYI